MTQSVTWAVRPEARYTCHGDGLCCVDVHAFGPLDDKEAAFFASMDARLVVLHEDGDRVLSEDTEGACMFKSEAGCALHAQLGAQGKPAACNQFPFRLVSTPDGGRVATDHRCPCRTMGERAPLDVGEALECCDTEKPDRTIRGSLPWAAEEVVSFTEWRARESTALKAIAAGEGLGAIPFGGGDWRALADALSAIEGDSRFVAAIHCFASVVREEPFTMPPWSDAFDRAEARSEERDPQDMLREWLADQVWSLEWAFAGSFAQAKIDLATRALVAERIAMSLDARGDRAMAEAIAVVELTALAPEHREFVGSLSAE